jgi:translocation and assembly module TamB
VGRAARLARAAGWIALSAAAAAGLLLALVALLAVLPYSRPFVASRVVRLLDEAIAGRLELEGIEVLARGGIEVRGLEVFDPDGHLVLSVERARVFADVTALRSRAIGFTVELDGPSVLLEEEAGGGVSLARAFAPAQRAERAPDEAGRGPAWTVHLSRVEIRRGDLWWVDARGETRVEASGLDVDGRGLHGAGRTRVDVRLRGALAEPVEGPIALELVGRITGGSLRVPVLRAEVAGTELSAVAEADLATRSGRAAVTRLGIVRDVVRALAPEAPPGDDLVAAGYVSSEGGVLTASLRAGPAVEGARGRADVAVAALLEAPGAALGFDVALERFDPARLLAAAPPGDVTLSARGAASGRSLRALRGRIEASVAPSRLRRGEVERAEIVARAERGRLEVSRAIVAAPGLAVDAVLGWREGGTVSGRAAVDARDLRRALANVAGLLGEDLPALGGRARISATLAGTSAVPELRGTVDAPALRVGGVSFTGVRLAASGAGPARAPSGMVAGTIAAIRRGGGDLAQAVALRAALAREEGSVSATAQVPGFRDPASLTAKGRLGERRETIELAELVLAFPGGRWGLAAPARVVLAGPSVDRLELASDAQRIAVSGGLGRRGALDVRAEIVKLDLARLPEGLIPAAAAVRGSVSADLRAKGSAARPEASATFTLADGALRNLFGVSAVGSARYSGEARRAAVSVALSRASGGTVDVEADLPVPVARRPGARVAARVRVRDVPLGEALAAAGIARVPVAGVVGLDATLDGTAGAAALRADATLADAAFDDLDGWAVELSIDDPGERLRVAARIAQAGGGALVADGEVPLVVSDLLARPGEALRALADARLEGSATATALDLATLAGWRGVPADLAGVVDAKASLSGSARAPRGGAALTLARGAAAGYRELGLEVELALGDRAVSAAGRATVAGDLAFRFEAALDAPAERLGASRSLRAAPLRADVVAPGLPLARAGTEAVPLGGTVAGRITARGTLAAPELAVEATGEGVSVSGRPLGVAQVSGRYAARRTTAELQLRPQAGGTLRATAALEHDLGLGAGAGPLAEAPAELRAVAEALDLGFLPAVAPGVVRAAGGKLDLDLRARGPLGRLEPRGTLRVQEGTLAITEYGDLAGITLAAAVTDDAVELSRLDVRRGSGRVVARAALRGLRGERARLEAHLTSERFTLVRAGMDVATVDAQVDATGSYAGRTLAVEVQVPRGVVDLPDRAPRTLQTLDRRKDIVVGRREARRRAKPPGTEAGPAAERPFTLAAHVVVPRGLFVRSDDPEIDLELKADVRYERVGGEAYAEGSAEVVRGTVEPIGGRTFVVERGRVQFTGGPPGAAMLDVQARYDNPAAVVTVTVQGPLTQPEIQLSSEPPMDDAQIAMLIATGRTEIKAGSGGVGTLTGEEAGRAALGALATQAFKDLVADKLPLDTVALDSGAIRAGKYVTDKIYVGYTRRFEADPERGENADEVRVEYQITPRWTFESRYGTAQSGGASLIWSKDY